MLRDYMMRKRREAERISAGEFQVHFLGWIKTISAASRR
jgi:hypothetical protein